MTRAQVSTSEVRNILFDSPVVRKKIYRNCVKRCIRFCWQRIFDVRDAIVSRIEVDRARLKIQIMCCTPEKCAVSCRVCICDMHIFPLPHYVISTCRRLTRLFTTIPSFFPFYVCSRISNVNAENALFFHFTFPCIFV